MNIHIISITGDIASGKGTITNLLQKELGYNVYKNKNIVTSPTVLTCKGDILSSCDYEYADTDRFKICNYNDDLEFFVRSKGVYVDLEHCGVATYIYRWFDHIRKNGGNI